MKRQLIFLEEATRGGGQAQGENGGVFVRHGAGDRSRHVGKEDGVFLESALRRIVAIFVRSDGMTEHTVAHLETRDSVANLDDLARDIRA